MSRRSTVAVMVIALTMAAMATSGHAVAASFWTAQRLKDLCQNHRGTFNNGVCMGFVVGVVDSLSGKRLACLPKGVNVGQVIDVVEKHLKDHPEKGHLSAESVVEVSLLQIWPCK